MIKKIDSQRDVLLIGAGGHAKVVIEIMKKYHKDMNIIGILDKAQSKIGNKLQGVPVIGDDSILSTLYNDGLRKVFISLGTVKNYSSRIEIYKIIQDIGFECINVINGTSIISDSAIIGQGNAIFAGVIINTEAQIGDNCIINTGSIIEHECVIGSNTHIAPGVSISGQAVIGDNCMIGVGTSIIQGVHVNNNCVIGAGSVVLKDIPPNSVAFGVPAKVVREINC